MAEAQAAGAKSKRQLKDRKGPSIQLTPGKMMSQLKKARSNRTRMKPADRTLRNIGKRVKQSQEADAVGGDIMDKKKVHKNGEPYKVQKVHHGRIAQKDNNGTKKPEEAEPIIESRLNAEVETGEKGI